MTRIEELQKGVWELLEVLVLWESPTHELLGKKWAEEVVTSVYAAAIKDAMKVLPEERIIHGYMPSENTPENNTWNEYRNEAINNLNGLMPPTV